jgi:hypothetical protein
LCLLPFFLRERLTAISRPPMVPKNTQVVLIGTVLMNNL